MNLTLFPSLPPHQIDAEVAEMRKAARGILGSRKKRIAFLHEVGVLASRNGKKSRRRQPSR